MLSALVAVIYSLSISAVRADVAADQEALIWTGFYDGKITGTMNDYTSDAIRHFQRSMGGAPTGELTSDQRAELYRAGGARRADVGFQNVVDSVTGVGIGIPTRLASIASTTNWGSSWQAPDDSINIDTLRFVGRPSLSELHRKLCSVKGRVLRYSPLRADWFVLEGEDRDGRQFYVRADTSRNEVRAFSVTYPRSSKSFSFPIAIAMAASFAPFSGGGISSVPVPITVPPASTPSTAGDCFNGLGAACPKIALGQ